MHKLHELKEMLCKELEEYGSAELNVGELDIVDKLAHAIKNIDKIIMAKEFEDSGYFERGNYRGGDYRDGGYRDGYRDGGYEDSYYARGRGRNARRDSRGRYYEDEMMDELKQLVNKAPDQKTRQELEKFIMKMEQM